MIPEWPTQPEEESGIFFSSHEIEFTLPDEPAVTDWLLDSFSAEGTEVHRIDYVFCSDDYLLEINRRHLDHDFYTDIITFPLNENPHMAEIYISIDRVTENAATMGMPFREELLRVIIHGALHLCGYDDHEDDDIREIREKEEFYLRKISKPLH